MLITLGAFLVGFTTVIVNMANIKDLFSSKTNSNDTQKVVIVNPFNVIPNDIQRVEASTLSKIDSVKVEITDVFVSQKNENILELDFRFENNSNYSVSINKFTLESDFLDSTRFNKFIPSDTTNVYISRKSSMNEILIIDDTSYVVIENVVYKLKKNLFITSLKKNIKNKKKFFGEDNLYRVDTSRHDLLELILSKEKVMSLKYTQDITKVMSLKLEPRDVDRFLMKIDYSESTARNDCYIRVNFETSAGIISYDSTINLLALEKQKIIN